MKYIISLIVIAFAFFGVCLSLICLYASPDEKVYVLEASLFFLASSISIAGLLFYLSNQKKNQGN